MNSSWLTIFIMCASVCVFTNLNSTSSAKTTAHKSARSHIANIAYFHFIEFLCRFSKICYFLSIQFLELALNFLSFIRVSFRLKSNKRARVCTVNKKNHTHTHTNNKKEKKVYDKKGLLILSK